MRMDLSDPEKDDDIVELYPWNTKDEFLKTLAVVFPKKLIYNENVGERLEQDQRKFFSTQYAAIVYYNIDPA